MVTLVPSTNAAGAGAEQLPVDQHAACAAHAHTAALFGAGQPQLVAQKVDQAEVCGHAQFAPRPIQLESQRVLASQSHCGAMLARYASGDPPRHATAPAEQA